MPDALGCIRRSFLVLALPLARQAIDRWRKCRTFASSTIQTIYKPFKTHNNIMAKLFYRKYQNNNPQNSGYGKWYGRVVITETVDIEYLATKMQDNCTVKRADILAVLSELGPTMSDLLKDSKRVRIPYLGCFKLGIKTTGEEDPEKFNARTNVDNVHVIFQPETKATEAGKMVKVLVEGVSMSEKKKTSVWTIVIRVVIAVATTLLGVVGGSEAYSAIIGN